MPFIQLDDLETKEIVSGIVGRFVHTERVTIGHFTIEEGAILPAHAHPHEQITTMLEGQLEFTLGDETQVLEPGKTVVIPGDVTHSAKALTRCWVIDVFQPPRDDYR